MIIKNGIKGIGGFSNCTGITSVTIPDSVTNIGNKAFYDARILSSVIIPSNVTKIEDSAFAYCSRLTSITVEATTPPELAAYALYIPSGLKIYVPSESVETYKAAQNWSYYEQYIQAIQ